MTEMKRSLSIFDASCRVALAALLHDIGKVYQRTNQTDSQKLENDKQLYCPRNPQGEYSHVHAAFTAAAIGLIEKDLPPLSGAPFHGDDSLINAAAAHHRPETFLQWVIAAADRLSSGFERHPDSTISGGNHAHITQRLLPVLEGANISNPQKPWEKRFSNQYCLELRPLSPASLFPIKQKARQLPEAAREYQNLWDGFCSALKNIPCAHQQDLALWMDHLDSLLLTYLHAVPSSTYHTLPDVSLYDHLHTTAALATALWRYHHETGLETTQQVELSNPQNLNAPKFLLVMGDFTGIQEFIFATGGATQKRANKLLRGRSMMVSMITETAILTVLEKLQLPPTSVVINAAGKFLILAPNTPATLDALQACQTDIRKWFAKNLYYRCSLVLAHLPVSCGDFLSETSGQSQSFVFTQTIRRLFETLDTAKHRDFEWLEPNAPDPVLSWFFQDFNPQLGLCNIDGQLPAQLQQHNLNLCRIAASQIQIGDAVAKQDYLAVYKTTDSQNPGGLEILGYRLLFSGNPEKLKNSTNGALRVWDISLPEKDPHAPLFRGLARRNIHAWVPLNSSGEVMDLSEIAASDTLLPPNAGTKALGVLKGDVDNLGSIFQTGLERTTFARWAGCSRTLNAFFSVVLPYVFQYGSSGFPPGHSSPQTYDFQPVYTVFAGGDDFFLMGPWKTMIHLSLWMRSAFSCYAAQNPQLHFSAAMVMVKPGIPIRILAHTAEDALEQSKNYTHANGQDTKNALTVFGRTVSWDEMKTLLDLQGLLEKENASFPQFSTSYLYDLLEIVRMEENLQKKKGNLLYHMLWRSRFAYRTARFLEQIKEIDAAARQQHLAKLAQFFVHDGISKHHGNFEIPLFIHLYSQR